MMKSVMLFSPAIFMFLLVDEMVLIDTFGFFNSLLITIRIIIITIIVENNNNYYYKIYN